MGNEFRIIVKDSKKHLTDETNRIEIVNSK